MLDLIVDGIKAEVYAISLYERPDIPTSKMRIEKIEIDGRDGSLTRKKGYSDIEIEVELNIMETMLKPRLRQIKAWLLNASKISFTDDYDYFYKVKNVDIDDVENEIDCYGKFNCKFDCDPFLYSENGQMYRKLKSNTIVNLGTYESRPKFKLIGNGDLFVTINNKRVDVKNVVDYVEIDSESFTCTRDTLNILSQMTGEFPTLKVGENTISGNCKIEYMTRERYV
ncbi:phage tail family protein [Clostridioides mangenotii]|uniref:distal tail protein Dit n=1 Tax=Metaclostridioides mangenotii TaxID=1540 RepID=UPI002149FCA4|nr:distal tail protein Dit [Clostridioides mangenotii]MCR1955226.1 phage tail family protein [Clostridioides mangenotii]